MPMMTDRRHSCGGHFFKTRLPPFLPSGCFPIIYRLSQPVNQWKVCAVTSRQGKVREARSKPAAARIVPFHAGASTCRNNRYSDIWASCLIVAPAHSAFCPQLSFPGRRRRGQTVTHSACAVRRASGMSQAERVPILFAWQTVSFTRPSRHSSLL